MLFKKIIYRKRDNKVSKKIILQHFKTNLILFNFLNMAKLNYVSDLT